MKGVIYRKPDMGKISREFDNVVDMHFHTKYSPDSIADPRLMVKKAKRLNLGIAITDHNQIKGVKRMWEYRKDIPIIPGIEITDASCSHTLLYFYSYPELEDFFNAVLKKRLFRMPFFISKNMGYVLENAKDYNCVTCLPHPFSPGVNIKNVNMTPDMLDAVDLIEAINSFNLRARNIQAEQYAQMLGKSVTGGSDGHSVGELGSAVTAADGSSMEEFLDNVVKGKGLVVGKETNIIKKAVQTIGRETTQIGRNIRNKQQLTRLRAQFYINQSNIQSKIGNGRKRLSRLFFRKG